MRKMFVAFIVGIISMLNVAVCHTDAEVITTAALDMTELEVDIRWEFDFLPWYTPIDDAIAAFELEEGDYRRVDLTGGALVEFNYPSALTGEDTQVQLMFENMRYVKKNCMDMLLTGIRTVDTFADIESMIAYGNAVHVNWRDKLEQRGDMTYERMTPRWKALIDGFPDELEQDPNSAHRMSIIHSPRFTDPNGIERRPEQLINIGSSNYFREYLTSDDPYFAMYTYTVEIPD